MGNLKKSVLRRIANNAMLRAVRRLKIKYISISQASHDFNNNCCTLVRYVQHIEHVDVFGNVVVLSVDVECDKFTRIYWVKKRAWKLFAASIERIFWLMSKQAKKG